MPSKLFCREKVSQAKIQHWFQQVFVKGLMIHVEQVDGKLHNPITPINGASEAQATNFNKSSPLIFPSHVPYLNLPNRHLGLCLWCIHVHTNQEDTTIRRHSDHPVPHVPAGGIVVPS